MERCPIRYEFYTPTNPPKMLACGHTFCESCVHTLFTGGELKCPNCKTVYYNLDDVKTNYALLSNDPEKCAEHKEPAEQCCLTHALLLCERCTHRTAKCNFREFHSSSHDVHYELVTRAITLCEDLDPAHLPPTLRRQYDSRTRLNFSQLCELVNDLKRLRFPCVACAKVGVYISRSELAYYCEECAEWYQKKADGDLRNLSTTYIPIDDEQAARTELASVGWGLLSRCHFFYLTAYHYRCLYNPPNLLEMLKCVQNIKSLVGLRELQVSEFPETVLCPWCKKVMSREGLAIMRLPCRGVFHALCEECCSKKNEVQCGLDSRSYMVQALVPVRTEPLRDEPCGAGVSMRQEVLVSKSPFSLCGMPVAEFAPRGADEQCVDLFTRLLPVQDFPQAFSQFRESNDGYILKFGSGKKPVEVLTFTCYRTVTMIGLGVTTPVSPGVSLKVEYVKLYSGVSAKGSAIETCQTLPAVITAGSPLTTLYFSKPFHLPCNKPFTLKLKLAEPHNRLPVPLHAGNHLSRPKNPAGADGVTWEFRGTEEVEAMEWCSMQLYLFGPIVRVIYRGNT